VLLEPLDLGGSPHGMGVPDDALLSTGAMEVDGDIITERATA
jgi:hypothetical protein